MLSFCPLSVVRTLLFSVLLFPPVLYAQSVSFTGNQQAVVTYVFSGALATAADSGGNIYVADTSNHRVMKITPNATPNCSTGCTQIGGTLSNPIGVALDANGDVFVVDSSSLSLIKLDATGTVVRTTPTFSAPFGLAVDAAGNSYISLSGSLEKVDTTGVSSTMTNPIAGPSSIAIDANNNLYFGDIANGLVVKVTLGGTQSTIVDGLNTPSNIAVDAAGTVYVTNVNINAVLKVPAATSTVHCASGCTMLGTGLAAPAGLSIDAHGNVYALNDSGASLIKIGADVDFGFTNVATTTPISRTLLYQFTGTDCSAASTIRVLTKGASNKDFITSTSDCSTSPATVSVTINFTPKFSGLRTGAVQLIDADGNIQATTYLHGIGKGPQLTWIPGVTSTVTGDGAPPPP